MDDDMAFCEQIREPMFQDLEVFLENKGVGRVENKQNWETGVVSGLYRLQVLKFTAVWHMV